MAYERIWLWALLLSSMSCGDGAPSAGSSQEPASTADGSAGAAGVQAAPATAGSGGGQAAGRLMAGRRAAGTSAGAMALAGAGAASVASAGVPAAAAAVGGAGAPGGVTAGAGGAGVVSETGCTRMLLRSTLDAYFTALAAHDASTLMTADNAKFTENGEQLELGKAGLWMTAGALAHAHSAFDTEQCTVVAQAVVPDGGEPIPLAVRLKLEQQKITEIETIAVRDGDFMLASNTDALIASTMSVGWEEPVPQDQRNSREELTAWIDKYFRMFPRGVCDTTSDCKRIENGGGSFSCSAGASCAQNAPGAGDNALEPRLLLADVETGLGVGFTMFQTNTDVHFFKMYGGKVYGVSAILAKADDSGW